jgi:hypothetical protein
MTMQALELGSCVHVWVPQSEMEFHTEFNAKSITEFKLLSTIQFFDNFIKGVSEIKKVSKNEVLED